MWQKLSLRARINLLLALVLDARSGHQYRAAGAGGRRRAFRPRIKASIRLAREFIETIVAGLNEAPDPDARLNQIVHDLNRLRHVSITRQSDAVDASRADRPRRRQ